MTAVEITAAICTYKRRQMLRGTLASLANQSLEAERYRVIVVDNEPGETAEQYDGLESFPNVHWLKASSAGLSNARNLAMSACTTPLIAFLDDDAIASRDWLNQIASAFLELGERIFVIGGRVEAVWLAPRPAWLPDELLGHLSLVDRGNARRLLDPREWIAGTNMAFRTEQLKCIGGFSTRFGRCGGEEILLSNDENDVISRLRARGGDVGYVPGAVIQHLITPERLTQNWFRRRVVWQAISDYFQRPQEMFATARSHWNTVERFISGLPPEYQSLHSLCIEQSDPALFARQTTALYSHTIALLTGFRGVNV